MYLNGPFEIKSVLACKLIKFQGLIGYLGLNFTKYTLLKIKTAFIISEEL